MKLKATSLLSLSVFAISALVFTSSCSKSNSSSSSGISATIRGKTYQPATVQATDSVGFILVEGVSLSDTSGLSVEFPDTASINETYDIAHAFATVMYIKGMSFYQSWTGGAHGSLTVTALDKVNKKVAGQFSGVLYNAYGTGDSVIVTNGQFNTSYK